MNGPENPGRRSPSDVLFEDQVPRIKICLRSDPRPRADDTRAVDTPLNHRLVSDKHAVADVERLRMPKQHAPADDDAVPEPARQRTKHDAAHEAIERALAVRESSIEFHQGGRVGRRAQVVGQLDLETRISADRPVGMYGTDGTGRHVAH
jgi:hypothetical protein